MTKISAPKLFSFMEMILKIRTTEEFIATSFFNEKIFSFLHLMVGQEASPVGVCSALDKNDICLGNHRSHGHYLAKGGSLERMVYEIFGDIRGCCKGYGGSMHMLDRSVGFNGSTPILGSIPSIALGQAFALKFKNSDKLTAVFLGDGSAEEGIFMETINLAANKECRILFVIEDNKYSVASSHKDRKSENYSFKKLYEGLGAKYLKADGQDVLQVYQATKEAKKFTNQMIPVVLHLNVLRRHGHSGPMKELKNEDYRTGDSISFREKRDPVKILLANMISYGIQEKKINNFINTKILLFNKQLNAIKETINVRG